MSCSSDKIWLEYEKYIYKVLNKQTIKIPFHMVTYISNHQIKNNRESIKSLYLRKKQVSENFNDEMQSL
jgi:hypothetical protein